MLLRTTARRLRHTLRQRALASVPSSFADYGEADETSRDYAGNVRRLGRLLGERITAHNDEGAAVVAVVECFRHKAKTYRDALEAGNDKEAESTFAAMAAKVDSASLSFPASRASRYVLALCRKHSTTATTAAPSSLCAVMRSPSSRPRRRTFPA